MRKEHNVSEVTEAEGLTDAQFFYGEIMNLQKKCYALDKKNRELEEELTKAQEQIDCLSHIVYWLKSLSNINPKAIKAQILKTIRLYTKAAEICEKEYNNDIYFTDCLKIAEKELDK